LTQRIKQKQNKTKTGNVMQLKRFLGNLVKASLAMGVLAVPAFAGADIYYDQPNVGQQFIHHNEFSPSFQGDAPPVSYPTGCCYGGDSCCGHPINPAPECGWAYNPPAYPRCANCDCNPCNGFLDSVAFRADFLWWRGCVENIELGTEESFETISGPLSTTVNNRSHVKHPNFKYDPGFRIGFGNVCACDCWDFAVNWTHFRTKAHARGTSDFTDSNDITFVSDFERLIDVFPAFSRGRYTLNLDLVDIEFGRKFYVSNCFVLRPEFGLRIARINQHYRIHSDAAGTVPPSDISNFSSDTRLRSDFLAVGPRVGFDIELDVGCGMILFGQAAGSIVFGKFDNHSRELFGDLSDSATFDFEIRESAHRCSRAITDLAFGVKWVRCFEWCNRTHPVSLAFAWEHHGFFNVQNFNFVSGDLENDGTDVFLSGSGSRHQNGDIFTQGLTLTLGFGF
jgi:hypothetical protein